MVISLYQSLQLPFLTQTALLWFKLCTLQKIYSGVQPPVPQKVTLFGGMVFIEEIKLK